MDTDDLSIETYEGVLGEAENLHYDLTLQFGVLSSKCANEDEYLEAATQLINEFMTYDSELLSDIFFEDPPDLKTFRHKLRKMLRNIEKVKTIPLENRTFEEW